jgi:NAD(P)-dependent dehydrogenase (short-subunit alcohol dehydrogenase family)
MTTHARVALVTGGSRGIGLGICRALASEGFALAVNGVRPQNEVSETIAALESAAPGVAYFQADVSNVSGHAELLASIRNRFGRLDVLVNNAGMAPVERRDLLDATEDSYDRVMEVNLRAPYFLTQAVAKWLIEQQGSSSDFEGCIVNITSISSTHASVNRGEYCLSKAGLSMATKLWSVRLAEFGIPVYEVRPGIIETDMTSSVHEKYAKMIENGLLLAPRFGSPQDVGRAVALLASGRLRYSTGSVLTIDGGLSVERL